MIDERKQMKESMKMIDKLENKNVDKALAKHSVDGAPISPKKKGRKKEMTMNDFVVNDNGSAPYRSGW